MAEDNGICCPPPGPGTRMRALPNATSGMTTTPGQSCDNPLFVTECSPAAPVPITLDGQDCDGVVVPATGLPGQLTHVVQPPGQVFKVQLCTPPKDIEKVLLCGPLGEKVLAISDLTDPLAPVTTYWDLVAGAAWAGAHATLATCPDVDVESDPKEMCDNGVAFLRWFVKSNGVPTGTVFNTDLSGAVYTPSGAEVFGSCITSPVRKVLVFLREFDSPLGVQDIVGAVGTDRVQSITVVNIGPNNGNITDDYGNNTRLYAGQTWSWSAVTGSDFQDMLGASSLIFDASGTVFQVTAAIIP